MTDKLSLNKNKRIKRSKNFNKIFAQGTKINSAHFSLIYLHGDDKKFGFAVSQKLKGAVNRNKARRRLKELVRINQHKIPDNLNIIFIAKPGTERVKFDILMNELHQVLSQLRKVDT